MTHRDLDLIGREREQATLAQALAATHHGRGGIVLLAGEAGVGKTRLLEACLLHSGLLVLKSETSEIATPPYGPIVAALRAYLRVRPGGLADCGPLAPYLALLLPELGPPPNETDSAALVESIRYAFATIARDTPTVLVIDDLQWADNATLELLPALASALVQQRLLIIGTYRNDEILRGHPVRRLRNELRRARLLDEIVIEPLDEAATTALATRILGQPPGPVLAAELYERAEGVPLFVEELASALAASGRLRTSDVGIELIPGTHLPIPDTLRDAMLLRLDGLPDPALRLLELVAVAGREFDMVLAMELAGSADGFEALLKRGLLVEVEPGRAAFRHALIREAIYDDTSWVRRRALHRQLAERQEASGALPQVIAQHWLMAKEPDRARAALLVAARTSCAIHAYRDAVDAAQLGAKETYLTAFDFCQANATPAAAQLCIACLSVVLRQTGEWERAMTLCREVLASEHSSLHARAVASGMLGSLYALRGQPRQAQPLLIDAMALARRIELAAMKLLTAWGLAQVAELNGAYDTAAEHCHMILSCWEQVEDRHYAVPALRWAASFFATTRADADVRACANALAQIASATGQPEALAALAHALGELALLDGDPTQAVRQFDQALDLLHDVMVPYCRAEIQLRAGIACATVDQRDAAVVHLANAYRTARKLGARPLATRVAQALHALGEPIGERLGHGAAGRFRSGDLTRRQREILQLVALGQTNAEIAHQLVLSPRTVEMHVGNILATLDSRSRAEAVRRAAELGLLEEYGINPNKIP